MIVLFHGGSDTARTPFLAALSGRYLSEIMHKKVALIDLDWSVPSLHYEFGLCSAPKDKNPILFMGINAPDELIQKAGYSYDDSLPRLYIEGDYIDEPFWNKNNDTGLLHLLPVHRFKDDYNLQHLEGFKNFKARLNRMFDIVLVNDSTGLASLSPYMSEALSDIVIAVAEPGAGSRDRISKYLQNIKYTKSDKKLLGSLTQGFESAATRIHDFETTLKEQELISDTGQQVVQVAVLPSDDNELAVHHSFESAQDTALTKVISNIARSITLN